MFALSFIQMFSLLIFFIFFANGVAAILIVWDVFLVADNESSAAIMNETACCPLARAGEKHIFVGRGGGKRHIIHRNRARWLQSSHRRTIAVWHSQSFNCMNKFPFAYRDNERTINDRFKHSPCSVWVPGVWQWRMKREYAQLHMRERKIEPTRMTFAPRKCWADNCTRT